MAVTEASFLEFVDGTDLVNADSSRIAALITQIQIETNSYCGLDTEAHRDYAIRLHMAHYLEIDSRTAKFKKSTGGLEVKRLKSNNDEIEIHATTGDRYSLDKTEWGTRLESFLDAQYEGGLFLCG